MHRIFFLLIAVLFCVNALGVEDNFAFDHPEQRVLFLKLTGELRCPMCQNQNIADSDAMIAHDMRRKVYSLLKEGKSEQEIIQFMKERYGDFVYYKPPVTMATVWLWALPVLFIFVVMLLIVRRPANGGGDNDQEKLKRADMLLKQDRS